MDLAYDLLADEALVAIIVSLSEKSLRENDVRYQAAKKELLHRHAEHIIKTLGRYGIPSDVAGDAMEALIEKMGENLKDRKKPDFRRYIIENAVKMSKEAYSKYKAQFIRNLTIEGVLVSGALFIVGFLALKLYTAPQQSQTMASIQGQMSVNGSVDKKTVSAGDLLKAEKGDAKVQVTRRTSIYLSQGATLALYQLDKNNFEATLHEGQATFEVEPLKKGDSYQIHAGNATFAVVGTEFSINRGTDVVTLTVKDGKVLVYLPALTNTVNAGEQFSYTNKPVSESEKQEKPQIKTSLSKAPVDEKTVALSSSPAEVVAEVKPHFVQVEAVNFTKVNGMKKAGSVEGECLGFIEAGHNAFYRINVPLEGRYIVEFRYTSPKGKGIIKLMDGSGTELVKTKLSPTKTWENWQVIEAERSIALKAGENDLKIEAVEGEFNFRWFKLTLIE